MSLTPVVFNPWVGTFEYAMEPYLLGSKPFACRLAQKALSQLFAQTWRGTVEWWDEVTQSSVGRQAPWLWPLAKVLMLGCISCLPPSWSATHNPRLVEIIMLACPFSCNVTLLSCGCLSVCPDSGKVEDHLPYTYHLRRSQCFPFFIHQSKLIKLWVFFPNQARALEAHI